MKTFIMMTVVTVVVCATITPHDLLVQIITQAGRVDLETCGIKEVPTVSGNVGQCTEQFFCLAEKSLNHVKSCNTSLEKLSRLIHQYNNKTHCVNCTGNLNETNSVKKLLNEIKSCARYKLQHNKTCIHKNTHH